MVLTPAQARAFYDRFGGRQDSQAFYEDAAVDVLVAHSAFDRAQYVFEFGCGTGRLAERLLAREMDVRASYTGCDVSPVMVRLAGRRLRAHSDRATVLRTDGSVRFPLAQSSVDRVVSAYVLDLLSHDDIRGVFAEAQRVLVPGGRLCLVGLTEGVTPLSRVVAWFWKAVFRVRPSLLGGCRPVRLRSHIDERVWEVLHGSVVTACAIPSEVLVLRTRDASSKNGGHPPGSFPALGSSSTSERGNAVTGQPHDFAAPWGTALKAMSGLFTLLLLGIAWVGLRTEADMGPIWYATMVGIPLVILLVALNYTIRGYRLSADTLWVQRLGWNSEWSLEGLEAVAADSGAMVGSKRLLANGGLFSFSGRFRNKELGIYRAQATDPNRSVILRWPDRTLVITPDDPERFVRTLCELRGLEVQRPD